MNSSDEFSRYDDGDAFHGDSEALLDASPAADVVDLLGVLRAGGLAAAAGDGDGDAGREPVDLSWQDFAHCNQADPEAFFPEKGGSTKQAKSVCKRCPVTDDCLQYALKYRERYGIWGGTSEEQRRQILKSISDPTEAGLGRAG